MPRVSDTYYSSRKAKCLRQKPCCLVTTSWTKYTFSKTLSRLKRGEPRKKPASYSYRCTCDALGAKRSSSLCIGGTVEAPLACLRYASRGSLSDVLCYTIRIVLYARDVPPTRGKRAEIFRGSFRGRTFQQKSDSACLLCFSFACYSSGLQLVIAARKCALLCDRGSDNECEHYYTGGRKTEATFPFDIGESMCTIGCETTVSYFVHLLVLFNS